MLDKNRFVKDLGELVALESLSDRTGVAEKILDLIASKIDKRVKMERFENGVARVLVAGVGEDIFKPEIGYMVHADVVAGRPDQFEMKVDGDRLIGRGTYDMKFSIPMGVELLNTIVRNGFGASMSLVVTTDEEIGGFAGANYLAEKLNFRPKVLVVPDGGNDFGLVNKSKGVCQLLIAAKGKPTHASRPWNGKNANDMLVKLASELLKRYEKNNANETWETTMNIGQINGGVSANQVCPEAMMKLDFRFPETSSVEKIVGEVKTLASEIDGEISVSILSTGLPTYTDDKLPVVERFLAIAKKVAGRDILVEGEYGASDARHFAKYNIPILMMEPKGGDIHGENEWISLDSCVKYYEVLEEFVLSSEIE